MLCIADVLLMSETQPQEEDSLGKSDRGRNAFT